MNFECRRRRRLPARGWKGVRDENFTAKTVPEAEENVISIKLHYLIGLNRSRS